eukprot:GHVQ01017971.1.p1 GENE.GHVQ01017971.1~~GHVQ01017971.1.p1  ORF type:complete len:300 (+),score=51.98 GHVQ01017971.1:1353-2252(+)
MGGLHSSPGTPSSHSPSSSTSPPGRGILTPPSSLSPSSSYIPSPDTARITAAPGFLSLCCGAKRTFHVRVSGPAQAGKTSLVKWLKFRCFCRTTPTDGVEVEQVDFNDYSLILWDSRRASETEGWAFIGGGSGRGISQADMKGVIYVVDSADPGRLRIANRILDGLLRESSDKCVLLVLASKQDLAGALSVDDVQSQLMLHLIQDRTCGVFACSAKTGEGVEEGLMWLCREMVKEDGDGNVFCQSAVLSGGGMCKAIRDGSLTETAAALCGGPSVRGKKVGGSCCGGGGVSEGEYEISR